MRHPVGLVVVFLCTLGLSAAASAAGLQLGSPFSDHMVLQRDAPLIVWGWDKPGTTVTVEVAGQTQRDRCDIRGRWDVRLEPLPGSREPIPFRVAGTTEVALSDVVVGDVWLCSGQSNMEWPLRLAQDGDAEVAAATRPELRLYRVPRAISETPRPTCSAAWQRCTPETAGDFSAVGYFFGRDLAETIDVPIGLIASSYGGTPISAWMDDATLHESPLFAPILERTERYAREYGDLYQEFLEAYAAAATQPASKRPRVVEPPRPERNPNLASRTCNAMIVPLQPFALRGVIWYQGESNVERAWQYRALLAKLIESWRARWRNGELPFLIVQLASFEPGSDAADAAWAELRDAQDYVARETRHVGLVSTIDIGAAHDIHPRNKQEVGRRLALLAGQMAYGRKELAQGPRLASATRDGHAIRIKFDNVGEKLELRGETVTGLTIAGDDRVFHPASGTIDGGALLVTSDVVPEPAAVRYLWSGNPPCNLYNSAGLPTFPFRTDDWPLTTKDAR